MSASAEATGQGGGVSIPGTIRDVSGDIVGGDFNVSITAGAVIIQSPSSGAPRPVLAEPSLAWFPLADALEERTQSLQFAALGFPACRNIAWARRRPAENPGVVSQRFQYAYRALDHRAGRGRQDAAGRDGR